MKCVKCVLVMLMLAGTVWAQERVQLPERPKFWTRENTLYIAGITVATGIDAYTTNRGFEHIRNWQEHNPLIPHTQAGRAGYFAGTYAAGLAGAWLLQRTGHPRAARWALRIHLGVETQAAAWTGDHVW